MGTERAFPELLDDKEKGHEARKLFADAQQLLEKTIRLRLLRLQTKAQILPAWAEGDAIIIKDANGHEHQLPMPRSRRDEEQTKCLADYVLQREKDAAPPNDWICPFVVSAGVGLAERQERFRQDGDEYHAIMLKLLADRLAEAMAEKLSADLRDTLHWGQKNIRMAFGYGSCPDHSLKRQVFDILNIGPETGLSITSNNMINPGKASAD